MKTKSVLAAAVLALAAVSVHAARPAQWTMIDLGTLGTNAFGTAVNDRGDVIGNSSVTTPTNPFGKAHGFLWQNGVVTDLGEVSALGINNSGTIIGADDKLDGFIWRDGSWSALGVPEPLDINNGGVIMGSYVIPGGEHGFLRSYILRNGVFQDLGTLGGNGTAARAINASGAVVGDAELGGDLRTHAFLYDNGILRDLGTLGGERSRATDINEAGVVVGSSQDATHNVKAFIWDATLGMRPLFAGNESGSAEAINDRGSVVGRIDNRPFVLENGVLMRLDEISAVREGGWLDLQPSDINNRGWIVGSGHRAGSPYYHAFLLIPRQLKGG